MTDMTPAISSKHRFSAVWIIPLLAALMGIWMVIHTLMNEGPTITIEFHTAEGLEAGKTKVRLLDVDIGLVEEVTLKHDLSGVVAKVKLTLQAKPLLREDTRFWVVRARVGAGSVSGLGTILSGAYIEMSPGESETRKLAYIGLELPPVTPVGAPGLRLQVFSDRAGSLSTGDAVLFRGYEVGRVEAVSFDTDQRKVRFDIFIDAPFDQLVSSNSRFWDSSGIHINASASGLDVKMGSLDTILLGGMAFDRPPALPESEPATNGDVFNLYQSYDDILQNPYRHGTYFVVSFKQSLRGLNPGAPVEYRGIRIGRVERIMTKEIARQGVTGRGDPIPVLLYIEPGRIDIPDTQVAVQQMQAMIETGVSRGLRATLQTGSLITGQQLIYIDYFEDVEPAEVSTFANHIEIPTIETGIGRIETQVGSFLEKLNTMPLNQTVANANSTIRSAQETLESVNRLLNNQGIQNLPAELTATLADLQQTLDGFSQGGAMYQDLRSSMRLLESTIENLEALSNQLSANPNALIFPTRIQEDPQPEANR